MSLLAAIASTIRAVRRDGWVNDVAGLGRADRDKAVNWRHVRERRVPLETLAAAYEDDDVAAAVASRAPDAQLGRGYQVHTDDDRLEKLERAGDLLGLRDYFHAALIWEQLFGGSAVLVGADDGRPVSEPLDRRAVREVRLLRDLDPRDCWPVSRGGGVADARTAEHFRVSLGSWQRVVHRSRLVVLPGHPLPRRERRVRRGWGASRVERAWDAIAQFHASWAAANHALLDGSQGVFKIRGLAGVVASGERDALLERVRLADMCRSIARAVVVDRDEEDFTRSDSTHSGLAPVLEQRFLRLAQAARMPVVVLVGRSPAGLNATGESDVRLWYDDLEDDRQMRLRPAITDVLDLVARSSRGPYAGDPPAGWRVELGPLWRATSREEAEEDEIVIRTLAEAAKEGLVPREAAAARAAEVLELQDRIAARPDKPRGGLP